MVKHVAFKRKLFLDNLLLYISPALFSTNKQNEIVL